MIEISLVPTEALDDVWPFVSPMIDDAVQQSNGRFDLMGIYEDIIDGEQSLWIALNDHHIIGCCTVRIIRYNQTGLKTLSYEYLGGKDVGLWLPKGHEVLQTYAKEMECTRLEVSYGRAGWWPHLEKLGYRRPAVRYECEIKD